jgi:DUF971 family protein
MSSVATPRTITKSDPTRLVIEWSDGVTHDLPAPRLRDACPCARCVDEHTGAQRYDKRSTPAELTTTNVALCGHYALSVDFSDGHNTGIFTWDRLRRLGTRLDPPADSVGEDGEQ